MKVMEFLWLLVGLFSFFAGIHAWAHHDLKNTLIFFLLVVIAAFMFTLRMKLRKRKYQSKEIEGKQ